MPTVVYVSLQGDDQIARFTMDTATGALTLEERIAVPGGPAPMATDPDRRHLYVGRRGARILASYRIERPDGRLTPIGEVALETDPCWLAMDRAGRFVLSSYYEGAHCAVHRVDGDGVAVGPPVEWRETARGAHCMQTDPSNRYAFVSHVAGRAGTNAIYQFRFDAATGRLRPNDPPQVRPDRPDGPRHFCFHPTLNRVYVSNEQGCSVTVYAFGPETGSLEPIQTVSTLPPEGFAGENSCSKVQITPNGRYVYVPNRGHDSIAGFAVDPASGLLTALGQTPSEKTPRALCIAPDGRHLYSAGHASGRLASFRIDQATGRLQPLAVYPLGARPMWVLAVVV